MQLKHIWEDYTPEQEVEQAKWKTSPYKIPFPGKEKKKPEAKPVSGPDPFDTKPIAALKTPPPTAL